MGENKLGTSMRPIYSNVHSIKAKTIVHLLKQHAPLTAFQYHYMMAN